MTGPPLDTAMGRELSLEDRLSIHELVSLHGHLMDDGAVIVTSGGSEASVRSKGIGVLADGSVGSVAYEDLVVRVPDGWRITRRRAPPCSQQPALVQA